MIRPAGAFLLLIVMFSTAGAQFSGYASAGVASHSNPLCNYQNVADQLRQAFVELAYTNGDEPSGLAFRYMGGLMTFNHLTDRNYYEHSLLGTYSTRWLTGLPDTSQSDEEREEEDQSGEIHSVIDSTDSFLTLGLKVSARHDKVIHNDFDNQSAAFRSSYRFSMGTSSYARLSNDLGLRTYSKVTELSNVSDLFTAELGLCADSTLTSGFIGAVGAKYYTSSVYDTTRFEAPRGFSQNPTGKGKPGGQNLNATTKSILVQPQENGTIQVAASLFLRKDWSAQSSLLASVTYRWTPRSAVRYLAQQSASSLMTQDIYNDYFSYSGPEVGLRFVRPTVLNIQVILESEFALRRFEAPALSVAGDELGESRRDIRTSVSLYASRYTEIFSGIGLDLFVSAEFARNQSNDAYNDYSFSSVAAGLGVGF